MTPAFALDLNHDSIRLLKRSSSGWDELGAVALDAPDFADALTRLRDQARDGTSEPFETLLIIPPSQILYTTVALPGNSARVRDEDVASALEGATPLPLEELVFDWRQTADGIKVAVLEVTTLNEAEDFAAQYGFNPVGFTADSTPEQFPEAPDFGPLRADRPGAAKALSFASVRAETKIEDDPVSETEPDPVPAPEPAPDDHLAPEPEPTPAAAPAPKPTPDPRATTAAMAGPSTAARPAANGNPAGVFGNRAMPFEAAQGFRGPGLIILAVLMIAAALIWFALYLVRPDAPPGALVEPQAPPAQTAQTQAPGVPETARTEAPETDETELAALPEAEEETAPEPAPEAAAEAAAPGPDREAPLPPSELTDAPEATSRTAPPVQSRIGTPPETFSALVPLPGNEGPLDRAVMRERGRAAAFAPDAEALAPLAELTDFPLPITLSGFTPPVGQPAPMDVQARPLRPQLQTDTARLSPEPVWVVMPGVPAPPAESELDDLYVASIDPVILSGDAFALTPAPFDTTKNEPLPDPPAAGIEFDLDARGFVIATPEGALTPDGVLVLTPKDETIAPRPRPGDGATDENTAPNVALALPEGGVRPRPRPGNLIEQNERATLGGRSRGELGRLRPRPRPASPQAEAEAAALSAALSQSVDDAVQDALAAPPASANAIAVSRKPRRRPSNFASLVEVARASARRNEAASVSAAVAAPQTQRSPTVASVARQATVEGAINLRRLNLIGVYGSSSDRRALIRLPSGRYVKVQVGDSLDGGQVSAISDTALRYTKGSKSFVLQMPSG